MMHLISHVHRSLAVMSAQYLSFSSVLAGEKQMIPRNKLWQLLNASCMIVLVFHLVLYNQIVNTSSLLIQGNIGKCTQFETISAFSVRQLSVQSLKSGFTIARLIKQHTVISTDHMTPEIKLHLITPLCELWTANADNVPFSDPFWAFYWPGGQAIAR